jgi:sterol desaturase/sphingolipid hydroxylase (fatty acid hydroxylase superfamily)
MPDIKKFIFINTAFTVSGYLYYLTYMYNNIYLLYLFTVIKNSSLLYVSYYSTNSINHVKNINEIKIKKIDIYNCLLVSLIEIFSIFVCKKRMYSSILNESLYFIPLSFMFEIVFDLFHYITHRLAHTKYIYKYIHKKHHEYHDDTTILASFHQDPADLLLTNLLPLYLTSKIIPFSYPQYFTFLIYKSFIEISGHLGKTINSTSFCQFVWLPKIFNIDLHNLDHYNHHIKNNCNYSKRFNLWDKVFGTFNKYSK